MLAEPGFQAFTHNEDAATAGVRLVLKVALTPPQAPTVVCTANRVSPFHPIKLDKQLQLAAL
jgi:hypothetical protein